MNKLERKRTALKGRVTTLARLVDNHEVAPLSRIAAENNLTKLDKLTQENDDNYGQIVELCVTDAALIPHEELYNAEDFRLHVMREILTEIISDFTTPAPTSSTSTATISRTSSSARDVHLPKLQLPTFSGNRLEWLSFQDLFIAAVDSNNHLSGCQKLQYLNASLKGEPATLIQSFSLSNDNYAIAWKVLVDRYQDTRELIGHHFDHLLSIPTLHSENPVLLQKIVDRAKDCIRAVEVLKVPQNKAYELLIVHLLTKRLDSVSRLQWERQIEKGKLPSLQQFLEFGDHQAKVTAAAATSTTKKQPVEHRKQPTSVHHGAVSNSSSSKKASCPICHEGHNVFNCRSFNDLALDQKWILVKKKQLCFNCLASSHRSESCKSSHCRHCGGHHHSLLHRDESTAQQPPPQPAVRGHFASSTTSRGLLSTALIRIQDNSGEFQLCRALLDGGAESSFITSSCATRLGLRRQKVHVPLSGLAGINAGASTEAAEVSFSSCHNFNPKFKTTALILKTITCNLPSSPVGQQNWRHLRGLQLADPHFMDVSKIDILLGMDVFYDLLEPGKRRGPHGAPIAINSALGWLVGGKITGTRPADKVTTFMVQGDLDSTLKKFWELEELPAKKFLTPEETTCEDHFYQTHSRAPNGRFICRLPMRNSDTQLGDSRAMAVRRLKAGEKKNLADPKRYETYRNVMDEYLQLGHMEQVPGEDMGKSNVYYMPHHAVENLASSTTPFRVVFDASANSTSGASLNKSMLVGPKLQDDLCPMLIRFCKHQIAMMADIPKMYRQILIHKDDINWQRIVWRKSPEEPIRDYRLLTATFGTAAAPFLAIRCLQQLARDEKAEYPEAAAVILQDFYVDDLLTGCDTVEDAKYLHHQLMNLLARGGMSLRKWSSNSPALMEAIAPELKENLEAFDIEADNTVKTLGLKWHPAPDAFSFRVAPFSSSSITKRTVLSDISKIFDPIGWLVPVTITSKILMQSMWKENLGWDEDLPLSIQCSWKEYREQMAILETIRIPRCLTQEGAVEYQLHGFCDASEKAYAAVVYLRTVNAGGKIKVQMVAAKSKVSPVKQVSLPRLELCGAVLLIRLLDCVKESLKIPDIETHGWSDSTIVLAWLSSPPQRWKTFTANRVSEIQDVLPREGWSHVKSEENPADCASRGIPQAELLNHHLWWNGPSWLGHETLAFPAGPEFVGELPEERAVNVNLSREENTLLHKYSDLGKLLRITAYCLRWRRRRGAPQPQQQQPHPISATELESALLTWIKIVQNAEFREEIHCLKKREMVPASSRVKRLSPFLDEDDVLRVGGRLQKSKLHADGKHPIVLPKHHHLTQLIISDHHSRDLHNGPQALLASLQQKFWILAGRDVVRHFVRQCVKCCRFRAQCSQQKMGNLPTSRVTPASPFLRTGVDYAGPYTLTARKGRGQKGFKSYVALFVCHVTKAIHLELVSELTTDAFLAAFRRFIARRGRPSDMYSDNGTNFIGAKRTLDEYQRLLSSSAHTSRFQEELAKESIHWHLNPPASPHFGGLFEAGVKSMKYHLNRVIGAATLTTEEMRTLLAQVEAILNSRPITELSSDPVDLLPLTPGHFLIGRPLTALAEPGLTHLKEGHLSRWQRVQQMLQHFWRRWSTEYLGRLQQRNKWLKPNVDIFIGTLVLLKDDNLPPAKWSLGRVISMDPGTDDLVRVVTVKTSTSEFKRAVTKLCILPIG